VGSLCDGLFGVRNVIEEVKKTLHPGDLKGVVNSLIDSHQTETTTVLLASHIGPYKGPIPAESIRGTAVKSRMRARELPSRTFD
jgi:hypothetical protein